MIGVRFPLLVVVVARRRSLHCRCDGVRVGRLVGGPMQRWPHWQIAAAAAAATAAVAAVRIESVQMDRVACTRNVRCVWTLSASIVGECAAISIVSIIVRQREKLLCKFWRVKWRCAQMIDHFRRAYLMCTSRIINYCIRCVCTSRNLYARAFYYARRTT